MFDRVYSYTVHTRDEDDLILVKEGFNLWAFLFGPLWLLVNRVWVAGGLLLLLTLALRWAEHTRLVEAPHIDILQIALAVLIGFEANELKREALAQRGYTMVDIIRETSEAKAELEHYERTQAA